MLLFALSSVIYATFHCQSQRHHDELTATISRSVILPPTISREDPILAPGWPIAKPSPLPSSPVVVPGLGYPPSLHLYLQSRNRRPHTNMRRRQNMCQVY